MGLALVASPASAAVFKSGNRADIERGRTVRQDAYLFGGTVTVSGEVDGDLICAGGTVIVDGDVSEDVIVAGGTVILNGEVGDDLRVSGGTVTINGPIKDDLIAAGGTLDVGPDATVGGDTVVGAGTLSLASAIRGNLNASAGTVTLSGTVDGNARLQADKVRLRDGAVIKGNLTYISEKKAQVEGDAEVLGRTTHRLPPAEERREPATAAGVVAGILFAIFWFFIWTIGTLLVGLTFVLTLRRPVTALADAMRTAPWASLGLGLAVLFIAPILILVLAFTLIGLPLASVLCVLYVLAIYLSVILTGIVLGRTIIRPLVKTGEPSLIWSLLLGFTLLAILMAIPFLGGIVAFAAMVFGLGAIGVGTYRNCCVAPKTVPSAKRAK